MDEVQEKKSELDSWPLGDDGRSDLRLCPAGVMDGC